jgi:hypothetical protein
MRIALEPYEKHAVVEHRKGVGGGGDEASKKIVVEFVGPGDEPERDEP